MIIFGIFWNSHVGVLVLHCATISAYAAFYGIQNGAECSADVSFTTSLSSVYVGSYLGVFEVCVCVWLLVSVWLPVLVRVCVCMCFLLCGCGGVC